MFHQHEIVKKNRTFHEIKKKLNSVENFAKIQTFGHYVYNLARLEKKYFLKLKKTWHFFLHNGKHFTIFLKFICQMKKKSLFFLSLYHVFNFLIDQNGQFRKLG